MRPRTRRLPTLKSTIDDLGMVCRPLWTFRLSEVFSTFMVNELDVTLAQLPSTRVPFARCRITYLPANISGVRFHATCSSALTEVTTAKKRIMARITELYAGKLA